jgi:hypothetical protein
VKTSPTQRSLKHLRESGYVCQVVERWNAFAHIRQDLFGWIDIVAVHPELGILGVQTTTRENLNARMDKARGNLALLSWRLYGSLHAHGWKKRANRWVVDIRVLEVQDLTVKGEGV